MPLGYRDWSDYYEEGLIPNIWKGITGQTSADRNADKNLQYQQERNEIEDARYEEERDYNRAFAEEERDYNRAWAEEQRDYERALQQQIFEREDTAISRQVQELSKLGINPVGQNLNGLGAGQALSSTSGPASTPAPAMSTRGGQALNRTMQKFGSLSEFLGSFESLLRPLQDINQSIQDYRTGNLQRDALALENDKQFLENFKVAHDLGIRYSGLFTGTKKGWRNMAKNNKAQYFVDTESGKNIFDIPEYNGTLFNGYYDGNVKNLNTFSRGGFDGILERSLTKGSKLVDSASNKLFNLDSSDSKKFNIFDFLKNIIF